jgi:hypothetical protein
VESRNLVRFSGAFRGVGQRVVSGMESASQVQCSLQNVSLDLKGRRETLSDETSVINKKERCYCVRGKGWGGEAG